jgi:hypothetical protein
VDGTVRDLHEKNPCLRETCTARVEVSVYKKEGNKFAVQVFPSPAFQFRNRQLQIQSFVNP